MKHYNAHGQVDHSDTSEGGYYVRVEDRRNYGCLVVIVGLLIVLALALFITSKVGAESSRVTNYALTGMMTGGDCQAKGAQGDTFLSVNDKVCQSSTGWGMRVNSPIMESMTEDSTVDTESRKNGKEESQETINTESPVADDNPPADDKKDESDNGKDDPKDSDGDEKDKKGNNGHGNNQDGVDSSNPGHGPHNDEGADESAPIDDENRGHSSIPLFATFLLVRIRKDRKEYAIWGVSSVKMSEDYPNELTLFFHDLETIRRVDNATILDVFPCDLDFSYTDDEVMEILK